MEILLLIGLVAGTAFDVLMIALLRSEFRDGRTRARAWVVLLAGLGLAASPYWARVAEGSAPHPGELTVPLIVLFGVSAAFVYTLLVVASAILRHAMDRSRRDGGAA